MRVRCFSLFVASALCLHGARPAQSAEFLEWAQQGLHFAGEDDAYRLDFSVLVDTTVFAAERPALGLLVEDDLVFFSPRLLAFADAQLGSRVRLHAQARLDRGFDPGSAPDGELRLDEYYLQFRLADEEKLNFRVGKFATAFGAWTRRSLNWENPLITAPMAYEDLLPITGRLVPDSGRTQAARRIAPDNKQEWLPILWGPSYAQGAQFFGRLDALEYAFEVKNAAISSHPRVWDEGFASIHPTFTGRLAFLPSPEWVIGSSMSHGPYLEPEARTLLPFGQGLNNFTQTTWGVDVAYSHRKLQIWSELLFSRFEVPNVGRLQLLSGFIEAKYRFSSVFWAALRWNQALIGDFPGSSQDWDQDTWRADLALGYRWGENWMAKVQYSLGDKKGTQTEGRHLGALQITWRF